MFTWVEHRTVNPERLHETIERAQRAFFPKLQQAPGFTGFSLVADEATGINTAIIVWQSKAQADAFDAKNSAWMRTLEAFGHPLQSDDRGETELYLGLVHLPDGVAGTQQRIVAARDVVAHVGVATERGLGPRPAATSPEVLRIHAAVAAPTR